MITSASRLHRALACPASLVLPHAPELPSPARDAAAAIGTAYHTWKETGEAPATLTPSHRKRLAGIDRLALWPADGAHEVAYTYNVVTRKVVRLGTGRAAYRDATGPLVCGTVDYVGDGWVDDLKTSKHMRCDWDQLAFGALMVAEEQGWQTDDVLMTTTQIPSAPQYAEPTQESRLQAPEDRATFRDKLERMYGAVLVARLQVADGAPPTVHPEEGRCKYCPARAACPSPADLPERRY